MRNYLHEYMKYSRAEKAGSFVLMALCIINFSLPLLYPYFLPKSPIDFSQFQTAINQYSEEVATSKDNVPTTLAFRTNPKDKASKLELFSFDPNTASQDDLRRLGLSHRVVQTLIKFRNKGGKFYTREDLQKVYGLRSEDYERLKNHIQINETKRQKNNIPKAYEAMEDERVIEYFEFDPNTASKEALEQLGLSKKLSQTIENYRNKGGKFYKKEDFQKMYGMSKALYEKLVPFIKITPIAYPSKGNNSVTEKTLPTKDKASSPLSIDINKASAEQWQKLSGIGPSFSKRIVHFREALGGFSSIQQVSETFGMPDSTFQKIKPHLQYSPILEKININKISLEALSKHPYLSFRQARGLINYRTQHGAFSSIEDLKKLGGAFKLEDWERLEVYLSFE